MKHSSQPSAKRSRQSSAAPSAIGSLVTVTIDRPLGTYHPEHADLYYPINYGYIKGIIAPDQEEQDAYIIGVDVPLDTFTGEVIAVIHRKNDVEEKWVVAPPGSHFDQEEIRRLTNFQEKYFDTEIELL